MGHVNNAVYLTYCEVGRIRYWTDVTGEPIGHGVEHPESLILAEARITYRAQIFYGEVVTVETRTTRIGRSSFTLQHRLLAAAPAASARLVAVSDSVLVRYDYATTAAVPLSDAHVAAIEAYEGRSLRARLTRPIRARLTGGCPAADRRASWALALDSAGHPPPSAAPLSRRHASEDRDGVLAAEPEPVDATVSTLAWRAVSGT